MKKEILLLIIPILVFSIIFGAIRGVNESNKFGEAVGICKYNRMNLEITKEGNFMCVKSSGCEVIETFDLKCDKGSFISLSFWLNECNWNLTKSIRGFER